jgi:Glycosyl hydrolases family 43
MYYSATTASHRRKHCIGAAISSTIAGPYTPLNTTISCDLAAGGAIDPDLFHDPQDDQYYLVYKVDGNSIGSGGACGNSNNPKAPTPIALQLLTSNHTAMVGPPHYLISNGLPNPENPSSNAIVSYPDGPNVEGPTMFFHNGSYYLAYNSGCFADESYKVKYLVCEGAPTVYACGRWTDGQSEESVLLKTGSSPGMYAPGSVDVVVGEQATRIVYHGDVNVGWFKNQSEQRVRGMFAAALVYKNSTVLVVSTSPAQSFRPPFSLAVCIAWVVIYLAVG